MRIVKGKVVGRTVVLEEALLLPEGSVVDVMVRQPGDDEDGVFVDDASEEELLRAMAEPETEEGVPVREVLERLRLPPKVSSP